MTAPLRLRGSTRLEPALRRAACRAGADLCTSPADAPSLEPAGVPVPADGELPAALLQRVLGDLLAALDPAPAGLDAVVVAPAAGVCGPAGSGPVDAVRLDGHLTLRTGGAEAHVHLLAAQQTRCWLAVCTLLPAAGPPSLRPDAPLEIVEPGLCRDTARLTQYLHDRGEGADWPGALVLGPPARGPGGRLCVELAFTERPLADDLVGRALRAMTAARTPGGP